MSFWKGAALVAATAIITYKSTKKIDDLAWRGKELLSDVAKTYIQKKVDEFLGVRPSPSGSKDPKDDPDYQEYLALKKRWESNSYGVPKQN